MKKNTLMTSCAAVALGLAVCGGKVLADAPVLCHGDENHEHAEKDGAHDHEGHDHDGDKDHDHGEKGHDHDGDDHKGHDHDAKGGDHEGHDHDAKDDDHAGHDHGDDGHTHEQKVAGPNGGRMLEKITPSAEFFVTEGRLVKITFVDDDGKVVAPTDQKVMVICGDRKAPTKLTFKADGDSLVSEAPLPAGDSLPAIVRVKSSADAKYVTDRFTVKFGECDECKHAEYACTCCAGHDH